MCMQQHRGHERSSICVMTIPHQFKRRKIEFSLSAVLDAAAHLGAPVVAAVGVDGDAQPWPKLAKVRIGDDVREHAAPLMHLHARYNSLKLLSVL